MPILPAIQRGLGRAERLLVDLRSQSCRVAYAASSDLAATAVRQTTGL